jgi:hypothetical protein
LDGIPYSNPATAEVIFLTIATRFCPTLLIFKINYEILVAMNLYLGHFSAASTYSWLLHQNGTQEEVLTFAFISFNRLYKPK